MIGVAGVRIFSRSTEFRDFVQFLEKQKVLVMMQAVEILYLFWVRVGVQGISRVFGDLPFPLHG